MYILLDYLFINTIETKKILLLKFQIIPVGAPIDKLMCFRILQITVG